MSHWEVDWSARVGRMVMARNPVSRWASAREWHPVKPDWVKRLGLPLPKVGTDWEVDWSKRRGNTVWARNLSSKKPAAREWRFVAKGTLITGGVKWMSSVEGRYKNSHGYWMRTRLSLTPDEIDLVFKSGLFQQSGAVKAVLEHRLVALKKYGSIPKGHVVRHVNGDKTDNRPENLVLGSHKENHTDHKTAVINAMYWRERAEAAEKRLAELLK